MKPQLQSVPLLQIVAAVVYLVMPVLSCGQPSVSPQCDDQKSTAFDGTLSLGECKASFVLVKGCTFTMGHAPDKLERVLSPILKRSAHGSRGLQKGTPPRPTTITKNYWLMTTKVTARMYCEFLNTSESPEQFIVLNRWSHIELRDNKYFPVPGKGEFPANTVPWIGADAFCQWASRVTSSVVRLPTEAEWELAARGCEGREYPWGAKSDSSKDYRDQNDGFGPVASNPSNTTPAGVHGMVGPVAEWCQDLWAEEFDLADNENPQGPVKGIARVMRGRDLSATTRFHQPESKQGVQGGLYGFRCVVDIKNITSPSRASSEPPTPLSVPKTSSEPPTPPGRSDGEERPPSEPR